MIYDQCPGARDIRQPRPEQIKCPHCGKTAEIWSDETKTKCAYCKTLIFRKEKASCLDWCAFAEECAGKEAVQKHRDRKVKPK